jgi:homoserine kinase type II
MAFYTILTKEDITDILTQFDLGALKQFAPMDGGQANSSYKATTTSGKYIICVCDEKGLDDIENLAMLLVYLKEKAYPTSRLIQAINGDYIVIYRGKPVYIKSYIDGCVEKVLTRNMLRQMGETLYQLHRIEAPEWLSGHFPYGMTAFDPLIATDMDHPFLTWLTNKKKHFDSHLDKDMKRGLIHGDLFWDNLLFSGGTLTAVLDFEEACCYYLLFDIGMCVIGCCTDGKTIDFGKAAALIEGYQKDRPLSASEQMQLKIFIEYAGTAGSFWRFQQYHIRQPNVALKESYRELKGYADQIHDMTLEEFMAQLFY